MLIPAQGRSGRDRGRARQQGMSLVELMVGVALGLFIVAGAATVASTQLADTRRLVVEAQVQQDLRASIDLMTRALRRAAYWNNSPAVIWSPAAAAAANPNDTVTVVPNTEADIAWSGANVLGFRLSGAPVGILQMKDGGGGWQALTDSVTLNVTSLGLQLVAVSPSATSAPATQAMACPAICADGTTACWPTIVVREIKLTITGQSLSDPNVVRTVVSSVRLRNDQIVNNNGGGPLCPT